MNCLTPSSIQYIPASSGKPGVSFDPLRQMPAKQVSNVKFSGWKDELQQTWNNYSRLAKDPTKDLKDAVEVAQKEAQALRRQIDQLDIQQKSDDWQKEFQGARQQIDELNKTANRIIDEVTQIKDLPGNIHQQASSSIKDKKSTLVQIGAGAAAIGLGYYLKNGNNSGLLSVLILSGSKIAANGLGKLAHSNSPGAKMAMGFAGILAANKFSSGVPHGVLKGVGTMHLNSGVLESLHPEKKRDSSNIGYHMKIGTTEAVGGIAAMLLTNSLSNNFPRIAEGALRPFLAAFSIGTIVHGGIEMGKGLIGTLKSNRLQVNHD